MILAFHTLDVFTEKRFGGNPLAVVLDADGLSQGRMQAIAREFNLSETVFVQKRTQPGALARARIFTPREELPFAGHPTIGTACLLAELGRTPGGDEANFVLEEGVGPVKVRVRREAGRALFAELTAAQAPEIGPAAPDDADIAAALGLSTGQIGFDYERPLFISCGLAFLLVPVNMPEVLAGIEVAPEKLSRLLTGSWAHSVYVYARGYDGELRARMFSHTIGEDPATGSAGAALAARLARDCPDRDASLSWELHQGVEMGRPSLLHLRADRRQGAVTAVRVGGYAVRVTEGRLNAD